MRAPLPSDDLDFVVERTADFWSRFDRARLFVTGGTGFIGTWLLEVVQHANRVTGSRIDTLVLSRDPQKAKAHAPHLFAAEGVTMLKGDVATFSAEPQPVDVCIHAATDVADLEKANDAMRLFDTGVIGTRRVLEFAKTNGATHFMLTSSGAVYGTQPAAIERTPETFAGAPDPLKLSSAYGEGKRAAEWLAAAFAQDGNLHVTIARIYAVLGPAIPLDGPFAAGNFIRDALAGKTIAINGDGRPLRSYLYMADACVWLLRLMLHGASGAAYNIGSEHEVSIVDLARMIERQCRSNTPAAPMKAPDGTPAPRYIPDTSKARKSLGVDEYTPLELALSKTINWNRAAVTA